MYMYVRVCVCVCLGYVLCGGSINSWLTSTNFEIQSVTKFVESAETPLDPEQIMYEFCELSGIARAAEKSKFLGHFLYVVSVRIIW